MFSLVGLLFGAWGGVRKVGSVQMRCMLYGSDNVGVYIFLPLGSEAVLISHSHAQVLMVWGGPRFGDQLRSDSDTEHTHHQ